MDQPRTRLPLPRARSVSHLRSQSQAQASSIPITITKPGLSRKPSVPLRSNARQAVRVHHGTAPVPVEVRTARVASGVVTRPQSVVENTQTRARTFTSTATVTDADAGKRPGDETAAQVGMGRGSGADPFLVRQSSVPNLTTISNSKSQTLPTRFCPIAKSSQTMTKTKPLPVRPALPSHSIGPTTTATSTNTVAIATGRSRSTTGSSTGTTSTVSKSRHGTPLALGAKRRIGPVGTTKTKPQVSSTAKSTSYASLKPTSTTKAISRKPSSRLRGSPAPGPVAVPAPDSTGKDAQRRVGHVRSGTAISAADSGPSTALRPSPALAPVRVQKLHYGQPPAERQLRRVVSRGFAMTKLATSPDKTIHTPSPTKRSHQLVPTSASDPTALSGTPLMPRLISRHMQIPTDIENMPMIADASFDFGDSTNSTTTTMGPISDSNLEPNLDASIVNVAKSDLDVVSKSEHVELEQENEVLKSALRALEVATFRITSERDLARQSEAELQESIKRGRWEVVREAIKDEIERTRQYKEDLGRWRSVISLGSGVTGT